VINLIQMSIEVFDLEYVESLHRMFPILRAPAREISVQSVLRIQLAQVSIFFACKLSGGKPINLAVIEMLGAL
jgi:hypothetical protein